MNKATTQAGLEAARASLRYGRTSPEHYIAYWRYRAALRTDPTRSAKMMRAVHAVTTFLLGPIHGPP